MKIAGVLSLVGFAAVTSFSVASFGAQSEPNNGVKGVANPAALGEGRSLFNQTCAHCHGSDASTALSERDLRRLKLRYGTEMHEVFDLTVKNGRSDKGMPAWGEVLDAQSIDKIYHYLTAVQDE
jgi:polar amino acid transport system substrate-binding protein